MKRIGEVIPAIFDEKFLEKTRGYSAFFDCWEDLMVKNNIAAAAGHSWIKSAEKGLVWIEVDHPGWKQILQTKESKLLHDFRYRFPDMDISGISIVLCKPGSNKEQIAGSKEQREVANRVGASGEQGAESSEQNKESPATQTCDTQYSEIKDEALRTLLERLENHIVEKESHSSS
jgi:hypothetical protein